MDLHVANGDEAVEPGVGHLLDEGLLAHARDAGKQLRALGLLAGRDGCAIDLDELVGGRHVGT